MKKDKRQAALNRIATKKDILTCIVLGFVFLFLLGFGAVMVCIKEQVSPLGAILVTVAAMVLYGFGLWIWAFVRRQQNKAVLDYSITTLLDSTVGRVVEKMDIPVIACNEKGLMCWYNQAFEKLSRTGAKDRLEQGSILPETASDGYLKMMGRTFRGQSISVVSENHRYQFIILDDCTDFLQLQRDHHDEHTAVAYISVDSVDEMTQYIGGSVREALSEVDDTIKTWVAEHNGVIKSYDNDKYVVLLDTKNLEACVKDRFEILDKIRATRVGDGISITISLGISNVKGTLADREKHAQSALDLALQRGGDQVVYKKDDGIEFFGGRTKAVYKRSNVKARVISSQITSLICRASEVIIMGHKTPDYDSFASCVGLAKLAYANNKPFRIVLDKNDKNMAPCFALANKVPHLKEAFISAKEGLSMMKNDTLLILSDVNNLAISESPELAKKARNIVVVDHHIKKEELPDTVKLSYIEPTASSAAELVSELLEFGPALIQFVPEEAEILLSGILLDTKQFTRNTGTRTFAAAQYLRGQGANTGNVSEMFRSDVDELAKESQLLSSLTLFDSDIAIASANEDFGAAGRILASKVADKMLALKNVEASFTLIRHKAVINISGRSNGNINVQLILEEIGGGGHFDVAGAQIESNDMNYVIGLLKQSILKYKQNNK